jgi:hypothetical protein
MQDLKAKREIFLLFLWMERENSDPLRNNGGLCLVVLCVVCRESCSRVQIDAGGSTRGERERERGEGLLQRKILHDNIYILLFVFSNMQMTSLCPCVLRK